MKNILHVDLNAFYASVEQAIHPELKGLPVAVAGDASKRNGIVLTSSYEARALGVKTAMTIGEARNVCPSILLIKPNYKSYFMYSISVMNILKSFTPDVEQYSIDEAWLDITGCEGIFGNPKEIGDRIREKIVEQLNITASVGVSYCKLVAKMASDMKKPDGTTVIMREDVPSMIWPLPIEDLIGVGRKMKPKLNELGIFRIGDLANMQLSLLEKRFGKMGRYLWYFANGIDNSRVCSESDEVKGVGNSITTPRDLNSIEEASEVIMALSESVGTRLREQLQEGNVIEIMIKTKDFMSCMRQKKLPYFTNSTREIHKRALILLKENWEGKVPLRLLGVRVTGLMPASKYEQLSFFEEKLKQKNKRIDKCMDKIRDRYGYESVLRASLMVNESYKMLETDSETE
ncbi:MAG: dinB [Clostridiales bacterium]|jgi:DNA polymerase-4|nr:dinB [Clostridiales bacterium]